MKKFFKCIGRIIAVLLALIIVIAAVGVGWGFVQMNVGEVMELPQVAEDFVPEIRLVIFTDTHNENERVANMIDKAHEMYDNAPLYSGIDGFFNLGDFSSIGEPWDYDNYIAETDNHLKEDDLLVTLLGNHEMKKDSCAELFVEKFGYSPNKVYEINGFSVIAFSGERSLTEWTFTPKSLVWAKNALTEAEEKAGDKPIIVLQHPHNFGTVYGSTVWCTPQTNFVWSGHNKVVCFSGHSHFPMNDPRSINQTNYTNVGAGAMARFEVDKNFIPGQHPASYDNACQFIIMEASSSGAVRILEYDLNTNTFFNEYFIENVNDPSTYAYTYKNMKAHDSAPVFGEDFSVSATKNENDYGFVFSDAKCDTIVHHYNVKLRDGDKVVYSETVLNDYYDLACSTSAFNVGADILESGREYTLEIVAVSAYRYKSETKTQTVVIP